MVRRRIQGARLHQHGVAVRVFVLYGDYQPVRFHFEGAQAQGGGKVGGRVGGRGGRG